MGMTILHAALLKPLHDCYSLEHYEFDEDLLQQYIEELLTNEPTQYTE